MAKGKKTTQVGEFSDPYDYRDHLSSLGYKDWGWQNGWSQKTEEAYADAIKSSTNRVEEIQWNNRGTDCTRAYHDLKLYSSVDMGD